MTDDDVRIRIAAAWSRLYGVEASIESIRALSAGASARTYAFTIVADGRETRCVAQLASGGDPFAGSLSKHEQARTQQSAHAAGVTTPEVLLTVGADDDLPEGFVSRHVDGETLGKRIVGDDRFAQARAQLPTDCADTLARIHALDPSRFPQLRTRDAASQVDEMAASHRAFGDALPVFEATFAYLRAHLPKPSAPRVVHGDFRTGNLLVDERGLSGVLDWELAHLGDPLEDLGWLCMRSWRFGRNDRPVGGFGAREPFLRRYAQASGTAPDPGALRFWETLGTLKWGLICQNFAHSRLAGKTRTLEPALIGRRVSEVEIQLLDILEGRGT